ncbi:hypothetical protein N7532_001094 [Penicillium argentinense]|uniref:Endoplasmic reticulum junction formation protein lunapark n=1 Tax=Penicillium argentinense TaxID=1131581 RepID=A0A9W9G1U3_9EURO|nr:uncharacterized protein N7532_001094 [Penicillium argentinense]KAJ5110559.1 hypothetical protein N7532_001094 [Penicillium argentinense]
MVSLWPFKGEDNSPASFEKILSGLSAKITQATTRLDRQRSQARRFKALFTLYSTFAYLVYSIVLALVLGWETWGAVEYAAVVGGPVLIYFVRDLTSRLFSYRISRTERQLEHLQQQRDETIEKLKVATKYDSTQQLLDKYDGKSPPQSPTNMPRGESNKDKKGKQGQNAPGPGRTNLPPPPTANIRPRPPPDGASPPPFLEPPLSRNPGPESMTNRLTNYPGELGKPHGPEGIPYPEETQVPSQQPYQQRPVDQAMFNPTPSFWGRCVNLMLGEDDISHRMVMLCARCKLINGHAPLEVHTAQELGQWQCMRCGTINGPPHPRTVLESNSPEALAKQPSQEAVGSEEETDVADNVKEKRPEDETHSSGDETEEDENAKE